MGSFGDWSSDESSNDSDAHEGSDSDEKAGQNNNKGNDNDKDDDDDDEDEDEDEDGLGYVHTMGSPIVVKISGRRRPVLRFHPVRSLEALRHDQVEVGPCFLAFKLTKTRSRLIRATLTQHGFVEMPEGSAEFNLHWSTSHVQPHQLKMLSMHQKVNHFPRSYELTRKDRLHVNIQRMQQLKGMRHFSFLPRTFLLPAELDEFHAEWARERGAWIAKPAAGSQGRGIFLVHHPKHVPSDTTLVLSQYIDNPLLVDGFKFDLRVYVAVTSYDPLRIYLFEDGLARFATQKYDASKAFLFDSFMHLTNYSLNKSSANYVACDQEDVEDYGNKWSLSALLRHLAKADIDVPLLMARMEDLIIKTVIAGELPIASAVRSFVPHHYNCFELYGFDILIDGDLKPWLIEVNLSPALACDAPLDFKLKSHLLADFFSLGQLSCSDVHALPGERHKRKGSAYAQVCDSAGNWKGLIG